ncbi:MAG TPA: hypothetical protein VFZ83_06580 [Acidimicrobiia bacterium]|nr:hypothetical protein [Acidimicrobiia bacterium]
MELTHCPYCGKPIEAESFSGGSLLLSCAHCGAGWEWHNAWLRRVRKPNRDAVLQARSEASAEHQP